MPQRKPVQAKSLKVGEPVMTPLGLGNVCFVYPVGPHHKITYSVSLEGFRINRIFDESQLQSLAPHPGLRRNLR